MNVFEFVSTTESLDVLEIVAVDIYDTRASVEFSATNLMLQDVNEYEIAVTPSAGGMAQIITVTKGIYTADITDLIGGTSYEVLLSAVLLNNEKDNETATTTFVTCKYCMHFIFTVSYSQLSYSQGNNMIPCIKRSRVYSYSSCALQIDLLFCKMFIDRRLVIK